MDCKPQPYLYSSNSYDPYTNLAFEELLFENLSEEQVILYLWQNENTIVIGQNQNAWYEVNLEEFHKNNGKVARRLSGGGAVFHDLGNLNFTFLSKKPFFDKQKQAQIICDAVNRFGLKAEQSGRNDILLDGKKFSGNAYYEKKDSCYHHGTILIQADFNKMSSYLTPSKEKMQAKGIKSVAQRVTNLADYSSLINVESMKRACIESFQTHFQQPIQVINPSSINHKRWEELIEQYKSEQWIYGKQSEFQYEIKCGLSAGFIHLQFQVLNGSIEDLSCYSDILNTDWIDHIKRIFLKSSFLKEVLLHRVEVEIQKEKIYGSKEYELFLKELEIEIENAFKKY